MLALCHTARASSLTYEIPCFQECTGHSERSEESIAKLRRSAVDCHSRRGAVLLRPLRKGATRSRPYQETCAPKPAPPAPVNRQALPSQRNTAGRQCADGSFAALRMTDSPDMVRPLDGAPVPHTSLLQRASHFCQLPSSGRPFGPRGCAVAGGDGAGARDAGNESDRACLAASRLPRPQSLLRGDTLRPRHDRASDGGQRAIDRLAASGRHCAPRGDVRPHCTELSAAAGTRTAAARLSPPSIVFSSR